jgi:hypothetical protein
MRRRTFATKVAERATGEVIAPNVRKEKRSWECATNSAGVIAEMEIPQRLDGHLGNIGRVPTPAYFYFDRAPGSRHL